MPSSQDEQWLLKEKYNGEKTEGFFADCERLKAGEPLAYVIGFVPFLNCKIWLDSHPLIPRPETEFWVEQAIREIEKHAAATPPRVLDLCAGSGCIGVAVANAIPSSEVDFAEIESSHLSTIEKNLIENTPVDQTNLCIIYDTERNKSVQRLQYKVFQSDLFAQISSQCTYDFILSNPPYIDPKLNRAQESVTQFEPHRALYGGPEGIELIGKIIAAAPTYLRQNGQLWFEHEPEQSEAIAIAARKHSFRAATHTDQFGVERYSVLVLQ